MSKDSDTKWICEACTFENWPSSVKCTMCRSKKPLLKENIYSLRDNPHERILEIDSDGYLEDSNKSNSAARAVTPDLSLWSCALCTFLNKENYSYCLQCESKRPKQNEKNYLENFRNSPSNCKNVLEDSEVEKAYKNINNGKHIRDEFENDDFYNNKIYKSYSQNLGFSHIDVKSNLIKSTSQNILDTSDKNKLYKSNSQIINEKQSPRTERIIVKKTKNVEDEIDSNKVVEIEKSPNKNVNINLKKTDSGRSFTKHVNVVNDEESCKYKYNNQNTSTAATQQQNKGQISLTQKWSCQHCTYENWPKSMRCIMCDLGHNPYTQTTSCSPVASPERDTARGGLPLNRNEDNYLSTLRRSNSRQAEINNSNVQQSTNNCEYERRLRLSRQADWNWLDACIGVVDGDPNPVEAYLSSGGNPARYLTAKEVSILNRPSAFDSGHTLVHLAIRFHREDMLATLLSQIEGSSSGVKRVPSYVAPDLAADIRRHVSTTLRQRKGSFPCYFVSEMTTFALPAEVEDLPTQVQDQLFQELLDKEVQSQLESDPAVVNWSLEITVQLGSRLYALWNRSAGDCLLDSVMQATWGVFDRENVLRRALSESLHHGGHLFYPRWKEYESSQASLLHFSLDETQYEDDWAGLLSLAGQPGSSLDQLHVFTLAHILRRPIIVYGVKYVKSFRGETLGYARFEGVYLPLLWEQSFCIRSPLALGYTRGHFSALVPLEPYSRLDCSTSLSGANNIDDGDHLMINFLPLMDRDRKLLPVHFLTHTEIGREENILRQWMDICITEGGIMVAQQRLHKRPLLVAQMLEEWLNHYRRLEQMSQAPFTSRALPVQEYSSEGETDDE